jgi:hypothetical protein
MEAHGEICGSHDWETIAQKMGEGFSARQVMDRWSYYLRPGISKENFTIEEKRESLRATLLHSGNWSRIAAKVGNGQTRSSAQVKNVVTTLEGKLSRIGIHLVHPDDVDALPDAFFQRSISCFEMEEIRAKFKDAQWEMKMKRTAQQA